MYSGGDATTASSKDSSSSSGRTQAGPARGGLLSLLRKRKGHQAEADAVELSTTEIKQPEACGSPVSLQVSPAAVTPTAGEGKASGTTETAEEVAAAEVIAENASSREHSQVLVPPPALQQSAVCGGGWSDEELMLASHKAAIWSRLQSIPVMVAVSRHEIYLGRLGGHRWVCGLWFWDFL